MARNIIINNDSNEQPVSLYNGDILIINQKVFMVTSYIKSKDEELPISRYCSMVDIQTGDKAFSEPCTRHNTTLNRIGSHLKYHKHKDDKIKIVRKNDYDVSIIFLND